MAGANLLLTDALTDELALAVEQGVPLETAAAAAGISQTQFYEWLRAAERGVWAHGTPISEATKNTLTVFAQRIRTAQARFEAKRVQNIARAAEEINDKTGQRDWRADAWILNNHPRYRRTYRIERQIEQTVTVTHRQEQQQALDVYETLGLDGLDQLERMLPPPPSALEG